MTLISGWIFNFECCLTVPFWLISFHKYLFNQQKYLFCFILYVPSFMKIATILWFSQWFEWYNLFCQNCNSVWIINLRFKFWMGSARSSFSPTSLHIEQWISLTKKFSDASRPYGCFNSLKVKAINYIEWYFVAKIVLT